MISATGRWLGIPLFTVGQSADISALAGSCSRVATGNRTSREPVEVPLEAAGSWGEQQEKCACCRHIRKEETELIVLKPEIGLRYRRPAGFLEKQLFIFVSMYSMHKGY